MKYSVLAFGLMINSLSFAATMNGITFSNLPTASKAYELTSMNEAELPALAEKIKAECLKDKATAEAIAVKTGSKIISSTGCDVSTSAPVYYDQGGVAAGSVKTKFEVMFK